MSLRSRMLAVCTVVALSVGGTVVAAVPAQAATTVPVSDPKLIGCITDTVGLTGLLHELLATLGLDAVVAKLGLLDCTGDGITDLTGLQGAAKLVNLDLDGNSIIDLSPLQNLTIGTLSVNDQVVSLTNAVAGEAITIPFPIDAVGHEIVPTVSSLSGVVDAVNHTVTWIAGGTQQLSWNDGKGFSGTATSLVTLPLLPKPTITGAAAVGQTLSSSGLSTYAYQWYRDGVAIDGATSQSYTLTAADADAQITVKTATTVLLLITAASTSDPTTAVTIETPVPTVTGVASVGSTLTGHAGTWSPGVALNYQWKRSTDRTPRSITGATSITYVPTTADIGLTLTLWVTGTAGDTTYIRSSAATPVVTAATTVPTDNSATLPLPAAASTATSVTVTPLPVATSAATSVLKRFVRTPTPKIVGKAIAGKKLSVTAGSWGKKVTFTYRWKANGKNIAAATHKTYRVTKKVAGKKLTVTVTAHLAGYVTAAKTSAPTKRVAH